MIGSAGLFNLFWAFTTYSPKEVNTRTFGWMEKP